jgi:23S rRNA (cytidine1920-2'-O)/16S rRNA (cytidine1409-2'-O)-methyltransferase
VLVAGAVADKPSRQVAPSEPLVVKDLPPRFASRGGEKLDGAIHHFKLDVVGRHALDAGASTGGFTDCLLAHGAAQVVAVDVGHGQLLERLRRDPRVEVVERANVRYLGPADLGGRRFDVVVADLSFISLMMVAPALLALAKPEADLVVLVKPQFEAGRAVVSKGKGVVRDPKVWASVLCDVAGAFEANGAAVVGGMASPLLGAEGNVEFFLHLRSGAKPPRARSAPTDLPPTEPAPSGPAPSPLAPSGLAPSPLARSMGELALSVVPPRVPNSRGRGRQ